MSKVVVFLDAKCGPSQQMSKALKGFQKKVEVETVLIQSDPARVAEQKVLAIPTVQVWNDNEEVIKTFVGYNVNIISKIEAVLNG